MEGAAQPPATAPPGPLAGVKRPRGPPPTLRLDVSQQRAPFQASTAVTNETDAWWKRMKLSNDSALASASKTTLGAVPVTGSGSKPLFATEAGPALETPRARLGALLQAAPVLVEAGSSLGLRYAVARNVLNRTYEDRSKVVALPAAGAALQPQSADGDQAPLTFFGVFDGHGGAVASEWACTHLHAYVCPCFHAPPSPAQPPCCDVAPRLVEAFRRADAALLAALEQSFAAKAATEAAAAPPAPTSATGAGGGVVSFRSQAPAPVELARCQGSTAVTAVVQHDSHDPGTVRVTVASVGDSRAVLVLQDGGVLPLTRQHSLTRAVLTPSSAAGRSRRGAPLDEPSVDADTAADPAAEAEAPVAPVLVASPQSRPVARAPSNSPQAGASRSASSGAQESAEDVEAATASFCRAHSHSSLASSSLCSAPDAASFLDGERARITSAGVGFDRHGFVGGILGLTRSLGNAPFKAAAPRAGGSGGAGALEDGAGGGEAGAAKTEEADAAASAPLVSAIIPDPDVVQVLVRTSVRAAGAESTAPLSSVASPPASAAAALCGVAFLVLATDGLWDALPDSEVARALLAPVSASPSDLATQLVAEAALRGASDDVTVCVVALKD